jgi:hypothetical protein
MLTGRQVNEEETMMVASMLAPASRGVDAGSSVGHTPQVLKQGRKKTDSY